MGATETKHAQTPPPPPGPVDETWHRPRDARNDAILHDLEEPLGELVRALNRRQLYRLVSDVEPPDHELLGRARALVHDLEDVVGELLDRSVVPTDPREWHDTLSMRSAFEDAAASAKDSLAGRGLMIDAPPTLAITSHAPRLHELLVELLGLAGRLQPSAWSIRVRVERNDG
ncbi:MAG TPA: hypothetical protein VIK61_10705, partial [Acidimicrobiia bacterium]